MARWSLQGDGAASLGLSFRAAVGGTWDLSDSVFLVFRGAKLPLALRASGLLLALPQSRQKARHRTRCFAAHRARQNSLRFSARRGCSDSTSLYCFAIAAIHRRDPAGIFPPRPRCSAPRTAPLIHESVHPCTTSRRWIGRVWLFCSCLCFCGRMPPKRPPCGAARVRRISPQEAAHDARPFAACTRTYIQRTP